MAHTGRNARNVQTEMLRKHMTTLRTADSSFLSYFKRKTKMFKLIIDSRLLKRKLNSTAFCMNKDFASKIVTSPRYRVRYIVRY